MIKWKSVDCSGKSRNSVD